MKLNLQLHPIMTFMFIEYFVIQKTLEVVAVQKTFPAQSCLGEESGIVVEHQIQD